MEKVLVEGFAEKVLESVKEPPQTPKFTWDGKSKNIFSGFLKRQEIPKTQMLYWKHFAFDEIISRQKPAASSFVKVSANEKKRKQYFPCIETTQSRVEVFINKIHNPLKIFDIEKYSSNTDVEKKKLRLIIEKVTNIANVVSILNELIDVDQTQLPKNFHRFVNEIQKNPTSKQIEDIIDDLVFGQDYSSTICSLLEATSLIPKENLAKICPDIVDIKECIEKNIENLRNIPDPFLLTRLPSLLQSDRNFKTIKEIWKRMPADKRCAFLLIYAQRIHMDLIPSLEPLLLYAYGWAPNLFDSYLSQGDDLLLIHTDRFCTIVAQDDDALLMEDYGYMQLDLPQGSGNLFEKIILTSAVKNAFCFLRKAFLDIVFTEFFHHASYAIFEHFSNDVISCCSSKKKKKKRTRTKKKLSFSPISFSSPPPSPPTAIISPIPIPPISILEPCAFLTWGRLAFEKDFSVVIK